MAGRTRSGGRSSREPAGGSRGRGARSPDSGLTQDVSAGVKRCELSLYCAVGAFVFPCLIGYVPSSAIQVVGPFVGIALTLLGLGYGIAGLLAFHRIGALPSTRELSPGALRSAVERVSGAKVKAWIGIVINGLVLLVIAALLLLAAAAAASGLDGQ